MMHNVWWVSPNGHDEKDWDPNDPSQVEEIKRFFREKIKAGFRAFALEKDGKYKPIQDFDEDAERIVLSAEKVKLVQGFTQG